MNGGNQKALVNETFVPATLAEIDPRSHEQIISDEVKRYLRVCEDMNDI
jgi:hypothetical protein